MVALITQRSLVEESTVYDVETSKSGPIATRQFCPNSAHQPKKRPHRTAQNDSRGYAQVAANSLYCDGVLRVRQIRLSGARGVVNQAGAPVQRCWQRLKPNGFSLYRGMPEGIP